ncbi:MAG: 30S ribosomal protein S20 [Tepidisphaeraceae bacterium]
MAHSLSAKKRVRQTLKRRARNRARKEAIKDQVKIVLGAITAGNWDKAQTELNKTTRRLDRTASKGTIHKNTAARRRSRLQKRLNAAKSAKTGAGTTAAKA